MGNVKFKWRPPNFEYAVDKVRNAPPYIQKEIIRTIDNLGELPCPAPASDSKGKYRIIHGNGRLLIQKLDVNGEWNQIKV